MTHVILIGLVLIVLMRDLLTEQPLAGELSASAILLGSLGPLAIIVLLQGLFTRRCAKRLNRLGDSHAIRLADLIVLISRLATLVALFFGVIVFGWLDLIQRFTGDLVLIDEALAVMPAVLVVVLGWWSIYPIDLAIREATQFQELEGEGFIAPAPSRVEFVMEQVRHQVLLVLGPVAVLLTWSEGLQWLSDVLAERWAWFARSEASEWLLNGVHLAGALLVLLMMPPLLTRIWRTVPLGEGPLLERLDEMCRRQGVRYRRILIWRTHAGMLNGAVMGMIPRFRYILLTDALLERLPPVEVEAVMAHELAHARRHHLPWLLAGLGASLGVAWMAAAWVAEAVLGDDLGHLSDVEYASVQAMMTTLALVAALLSLGLISRRFERQADAFAAQHLSGMDRTNHKDESMLIEPEAAHAMANALGRVAFLNHIPVGKFTWRHGSIRDRQRQLLKLVGQPVSGLAIDRSVRLIKVLIAIGLIAWIGMGIWIPMG